MTTSSEPTLPVPATAAAERAPARRGIPARKIILSVILACSIVYFFGLLLAGVAAVLHAAAPHDSPPVSYSVQIGHAIARRLSQLYHRI